MVLLCLMNAAPSPFSRIVDAFATPRGVRA